MRVGRLHAGVASSLAATLMLAGCGAVVGHESSSSDVRSAQPGAGVPLLGHPVMPDQEGYGQARPRTIFNGGDPTGRLTDITWSSWGTPEAVGVGTAFTIGDAQSVAGGHRQNGARVVAFDLGPCRGQLAYRKIEWYVPASGDWFDPANARNICTWQYTPWQPEFGRPWTPYLEGYGQVRPSAISNGAIWDRVSRIVWSSWGGAKAIGTGYVKDLSHTGPTGAPNAPFLKVTVIAYDLGWCHQVKAYRKFETVPIGAQFRPTTGWRICDPPPNDRP